MGKEPLTDKPDVLRRSLLVAGAAAVVMPHVALAQGRGQHTHRRADQDLLAHDHLRDGDPPEAVREGGHQGRAHDLSRRRGRVRGDRGRRHRPDPQLLLQRRRRPAEGCQCQVRGQRRQRLLRLVSGGEDDLSIKKVSELAGKKVGITSAGSGTDILARWTLAEHKIDFTRVPLGGGGLVPNLLTGNIDASVLYSPLTYKVIDEKVARPLIDYGAEVPAHSTGIGSPATRSSRSGRRRCRRRSTPSTAGYLSCKPTPIAPQPSSWSPRSTRSRRPWRREGARRQHQEALRHRSAMKPEWMERALDMARLMAPA